MVVAARADSIAVAVSTKVWRDEMKLAVESRCRDRLPRPGQVEEAVDEDHRVIEGHVIATPLEEVVAKAGRQGNPP